MLKFIKAFANKNNKKNIFRDNHIKYVQQLIKNRDIWCLRGTYRYNTHKDHGGSQIIINKFNKEEKQNIIDKICASKDIHGENKIYLCEIISTLLDRKCPELCLEIMPKNIVFWDGIQQLTIINNNINHHTKYDFFIELDIYKKKRDNYYSINYSLINDVDK